MGTMVNEPILPAPIIAITFFGYPLSEDSKYPGGRQKRPRILC